MAQTTELTDTQQGVLDKLEDGWTAVQVQTSWGHGMTDEYRATLRSPDGREGDRISTSTLRRLVTLGLAEFSIGGGRKVWRVKG